MWILPTRGRPANMARFIDAWERTACTVLSPPWYIRMDEDDPKRPAYEAIAWPQEFRLVRGPRAATCEAFNEAFDAFPGEPFYGMFADDVLPESTGWDAILQTEAGCGCVAYGDDGINGERQVTHCAIGGDLVRELGWICLPGLKRLYADNVITEIARKRQALRYRPDVKLTHLHFSNARAPMDDTYRKPEAEADRAVYERWLATC